MKTIPNLASLLLMLSALGCASPWERNFEPNPAMKGQAFAPSESVQVRTVEFERLQRYTAAEHERRVQSTTAPEDLPPAEQAAAKDRLLEALQLRERGGEIEVLGWSEFTYNERLDPRSDALAKFAEKIGADYVVVASDYAGTVARTIERPMTTYSHAYVTRYGRGRRPRSDIVTYTDTTWVPTTVTEDRYFYTAAFLRKWR